MSRLQKGCFFEMRRKRAWERKTKSELVLERAETEQGELKKLKKKNKEQIGFWVVLVQV